MHVTLRGRADAAVFRRQSVAAALLGCVRAAQRAAFRVLHFSFQRDHVHLVVEADSAAALSRGMQGLVIRLARTLNRVVGRQGRVFAERYHARALASPRAVRNALVYVLFNHRKHGHHGHMFDPCSSVAWFEGLAPMPPELERALPYRDGSTWPVEPPRTWLATTGWRRWGLVDVFETPRAPS